MNNYLRREWPFLLILLIQLVAAILIYPHMPDQVPIHWNVEGQIDDYGSKEFGTFFLPLLNIGMYLMFIILPKIDPKRSNYSKFDRSYQIIKYSLHIFMFLLFGLTVFSSLGYPINIGKWVAVSVALLFIVMGNTMGRVRHNYFVGFRFPWTLANEEVWKKTHQVGAKAMVAGGIISLIGIIFTNNRESFIVLMAGIFIPMLFVTVYSYLLYRKIAK